MVLVNATSNANNLPVKNEIKHIFLTGDENYAAVSDLIVKSLNLWSKKAYMDFFDDEINSFVEKEKLTPEELESYKISYLKGVDRMKTSDKLFAEAYDKVLNLKLSSDDLKLYLERYFKDNPLSSQSYNKALIPNTKACKNSAVAFAEGCNASFSWGCLAIVGMYIHC